MSLTPEQREARMAGIGGSEIAAVAGLPSFVGPIEVWGGKVDPNHQRPGTFRMDLGGLLEPVILELARRRTGLPIEANVRVYKHPTLPLVATPDGLVPGQPILIEAKSCSEWALADWGPDGSDVVPRQYVAQVQHTMHVLLACGVHVEEALVALLVGTKEVRIYRVPYARDIAEGLALAGTRFWEKYVLTKTAPPPDGTPSYDEYLERTYPRPERGAEVVAPKECASWAERYQKAAETKKAAEKAQREAEQQLCRTLGEAESLVGDGWRATWRPNKNGDRRFRFETMGAEQ